ncbi:MAG: osmotically-inducible protein OsmY [Gammaproteobacteria bacterium]|jgi:osmotically-inducible protein OsmY
MLANESLVIVSIDKLVKTDLQKDYNMRAIYRRGACTLIVITTVFTLAACAPIAPITATTAAVTNDPRTTGTVIEDEGLESRVNDIFRADQELSQSCHTNITSYNRRVLLTGECPTAELVAKAENYCNQVANVRAVHNEIVVGVPTMIAAHSADALITTKVKTKLFSIRSLPSKNVKVVTEAGVVFLMGIIDRESAAIAANQAATTAGVVRVVKLFEHP